MLERLATETRIWSWILVGFLSVTRIVYLTGPFDFRIDSH